MTSEVDRLLDTDETVDSYPMAPAAAAEAIRAASSMDELLVAFAMGVSFYVDHVQIYSSSEGALLGQLEIASGKLDMQRIRDRVFPLDGPSLMARVVSGSQIYVGPAPDTGPSAQLLAAAGIANVEDLLLIPLILKERTFCLAIGHAGSRSLSEEIVEPLVKLAAEASAALAERFSRHRPSDPALPALQLPAEPPPTAKEAAVDEELSRLLRELDEGSGRSMDAANRLLALGESVIPALWARFPGELREERMRRRLPRASQCSAVLKALVVLGRPVLRSIEPMLRDEHALRRFYATHLISELVHPEALPLLLIPCRDRDPAVKKLALHTLKGFSGIKGYDDVLRQLHQDLKQRDPRARKEGADALRLLCEPESVPALVELLEDPEQAVVKAAAEALRHLTKQDFKQERARWQTWWQENRYRHRVTWLIDGLTHKDPGIRATAAAELEEVRGEPFGFKVNLGKKELARIQRQCHEWWAFQRWMGDSEPEVAFKRPRQGD
jgi:hypothetical protein